MRHAIHRMVIGSIVACALGFAGTAGLTGAVGPILHVPQEYATIQSAVAAAQSGETVLVAAGIYRENVVVSTPGVHLLGAGDVVLDGTGRSGIGIHVVGTAAAPVMDVEVANFEVHHYERGIVVQEATTVRLSHNYVHDNVDTTPAAFGDSSGIFLMRSSQSDVSHNAVSRNGVSGIIVVGADNLVHHNRVHDNGLQLATPGGVGIFVTGAFGGPGNRVEHNTVEGNNGWGLRVQRNPGLPPLTGVLVAHNQVHGNRRAGIAIMGSATGNTVAYNDARDNNLSGLGPCFRCNLFDISVGRNGGNVWDKNFGTFSGTDACASPSAAGSAVVLDPRPDAAPTSQRTTSK